MLDRVRARYGDKAAETLPPATFLVERGALWWMERDRPLRHRGGYGLFYVDGAWRELEGLAAFRQALAHNLPDLAGVQDVVRTYTHFVRCEPLWTREDADDYNDPRWHTFTKYLEAFEPPRFDGKVLTFYVEDHGAFERVRVDAETYGVDVEKAPTLRR